MIIINQDKTIITNLDNLVHIYITNCEEDSPDFYIRVESVDSLYQDLGKYATEERAKEILQDIYSKLVDGKKNYRMPEE